MVNLRDLFSPNKTHGIQGPVDSTKPQCTATNNGDRNQTVKKKKGKKELRLFGFLVPSLDTDLLKEGETER